MDTEATPAVANQSRNLSWWEARKVKDYLSALEKSAKLDHRKSPRKAEAQLLRIEAELQSEDLDPLRRVRLVQRRMTLKDHLEGRGRPDPSVFEDDFIKAVPGYSERHNISYEAWREVGVPAAVLRRAGIRGSA